MITLRRPANEPRIELIPLLDVVFLLLTFFMYAMILMVRAEFLPLEMQEVTAGEPGLPAPALTVTIDPGGAISVNGEPATLDTVLEPIRAALAEDPATVVYLAADRRGATDRLPTFLELYDRLAFAGVDIRLVGMPPEP
jgi:biopolymer transport protein ExbD